MNDEDILLTKSTRRNWLLESPLGPVIPSFISALRHQHYADHTIAAYLQAIAHVGFWMGAEGVSLQNLDERFIRRFLVQHLPACACPISHSSRQADVRAACNHLLALLRLDHWLPASAGEEKTPTDVELGQFCHYLENICGLAATTCKYRVKHVREFLVRHFGTGAVDLGKLQPEHIEAFVTGFIGRWTPASLHVLSGSLNSYLRFRALSGDCVDALQAAIPHPALWIRGPLPKALSETQLAAFLATFDRSTPTGRRDYAVARCLADLGLRGQEVAGLCLDDVDWRSGSVTIRASKNKRVQRLPLPPLAGEALAEYLRTGRPETRLRSIFVRHRAPVDKPLSIAAIRNIANRAWVRCGLYGQFHNTHVLRHTLASRLHEAGTPVKGIADILRQQTLDTAASYVRIDQERLRLVALPWPGSQRRTRPDSGYMPSRRISPIGAASGLPSRSRVVSCGASRNSPGKPTRTSDSRWHSPKTGRAIRRPPIR